MGLNNYISTDKGDFRITKKGSYYHINGESGKVYTAVPSEPFCSCPDFMYNRKRNGMCKHLSAVLQAEKNANTDHNTELTAQPKIAEKEPEPLTTNKLHNILQSRIAIEAIIESSSDGLGEGVLYDRTRIGEVVKEDLVALIARSSGVVSETLGLEYETIDQGNGTKIILARARARATHTQTGISVIRSASVPLDFRRLEQEGRTFADRTAESDACRRAELALLGIPEKALVGLVKKVIARYKEGVPK